MMLRPHNCLGNLSDALEPPVGQNNVISLDTNGGNFYVVVTQQRSTTTVELTFLSFGVFRDLVYNIVSK